MDDAIWDVLSREWLPVAVIEKDRDSGSEVADVGGEVGEGEGDGLRSTNLEMSSLAVGLIRIS